MILVVSYPGEEHTDAVCERLAAAGEAVHRLDLSDFPGRCPVAFDWPGQAPPSLRLLGGPPIDLAAVDAVWWRRVRAFEIDPAVGPADRRQFAHSETEQAVLGMLDSIAAPWINPRGADDAAHRKPLQWTQAAAVGLTLPPTCVTTSPDAARAFCAAQRGAGVVFKPFLASIEDWRETRLVEEEDLARLDLVRLAPVIFQRCIRGVDLRVTMIGDAIFAAEIDARDSDYPVDMRMVIGQAKMRAVQLPAALAERLRALMRRLGLVYGAIDLKQDARGDYYFLEVNPAGQWLFVETRTGLPITQAHADALHRLAAGRRRRRLHSTQSSSPGRNDATSRRTGALAQRRSAGRG
ncbi:MvdC/MvdD family ATP grasp protein [Alicycliphilus denitrificans]|uniref:MvdC/MvdD family ATP grasp protein n=1 Tax=Alicycliphilus denitrificans TaxID=179636 RepID=UPI003850AD73